MNAEDVAEWHEGRAKVLLVMDKNDSGHAEQAAAIRDLIAERDDLQRTFDMMWSAQSRAIAAWQERHDKPMTWPGHERLVDWLLEDRERLRAALADAVEWMGQSDHTKPAEWVDNAIRALEPRK